MQRKHVPQFPDYFDDGSFYLCEIQVLAFADLQRKLGRNNTKSTAKSTLGEIYAVADNQLEFAVFKEAVNWIIQQAEEIRSLILPPLVDEYWEMRDLVIDSLDEIDPDEVAPVIQSAEELATLCRITELIVHDLSESGIPTFGIVLECTWEEEHGAGVRFEGLNVVASGHESEA